MADPRLIATDKDLREHPDDIANHPMNAPEQGHLQRFEEITGGYCFSRLLSILVWSLDDVVTPRVTMILRAKPSQIH